MPSSSRGARGAPVLAGAPQGPHPPSGETAPLSAGLAREQTPEAVPDPGERQTLHPAARSAPPGGAQGSSAARRRGCGGEPPGGGGGARHPDRRPPAPADHPQTTCRPSRRSARGPRGRWPGTWPRRRRGWGWGSSGTLRHIRGERGRTVGRSPASPHAPRGRRAGPSGRERGEHQLREGDAGRLEPGASRHPQVSSLPRRSVPDTGHKVLGQPRISQPQPGECQLGAFPAPVRMG
jgi:hypothetical protein